MYSHASIDAELRDWDVLTGADFLPAKSENEVYF
jgi:hypothetical protein